MLPNWTETSTEHWFMMGSSKLALLEAGIILPRHSYWKWLEDPLTHKAAKGPVTCPGCLEESEVRKSRSFRKTVGNFLFQRCSLDHQWFICFAWKRFQYLQVGSPWLEVHRALPDRNFLFSTRQVSTKISQHITCLLHCHHWSTQST